MTWLSSNVDIKCPGMPSLARVIIKEYQGKRIGFVGLLSSDTDMYDQSTKPFDGAKIEDPVVVAAQLATYLKAHERVDAIVLITHQALKDDIRLAMSGNYSVIVGGHDEDAYLGQINGCWILKGGVNAVNYGLIKLIWGDGADNVTVRAELRKSSDHAQDPYVKAVADQQYQNAADSEAVRDVQIHLLPWRSIVTYCKPLLLG
jgi:2',3'-cyclic-nucleotide 2'-phosphodiesterase (5'-nucleotidase family)